MAGLVVAGETDPIDEPCGRTRDPELGKESVFARANHDIHWILYVVLHVALLANLLGPQLLQRGADTIHFMQVDIEIPCRVALALMVTVYRVWGETQEQTCFPRYRGAEHAIEPVSREGFLRFFTSAGAGPFLYIT
jgi:hypothetical protein